ATLSCDALSLHDALPISLMGSFNPLGTSPTESFLQMVSPTILDPVVQVAENKTWYGGAIFPTKFDKNKPDSESYFSSVHPAFIRSEEHTSELQSRENLVC